MMKKFSFILIIGIILSSCSVNKRARKAIKRIGAEPIAVALTQLRPDLLRGDTIKIDSIIRIPFEVKVPEYIHDTAYIDTTTSCKKLNFEDRKLIFRSVEIDGKNNVWYKIKQQTIRDTAKTRIYIERPCPPCPGRSLIDEIKKQNEAKLAELTKKYDKTKLQRNWLAIILGCIIIILIIKRILPLLLQKLPL